MVEHQLHPGRNGRVRGLGWLIDRWTGHSTLFLPIGVIVGVALSLVLVYVRHGRS
ncbi:AtpZ/AtpI family protein [Yinghuangia aomiensis]